MNTISPSAPSERRRTWRAAGYLLMIAVAVGLFLLVREFGERLAPDAPAAVPVAASPAPAAGDMLFHVLLALVAVMVVGQLLGWVCKSLHQPPVIGEVIAGIILGPSLLGRLAPEAADWLLPAGVAPYLGIISEVGVILYMFTVGLELNADLLRERGQATVAISHASIVFPFVLGSALALPLFPALAGHHVAFTPFALFMGISMSVTAFPVLARILSDRQMTRSQLGVMALSCAATDDATAWCLLAFVVGVAKAELSGALTTVALTLAYITVMFFAVRPLLVRLLPRYQDRQFSRPAAGVVLVAVLISALITDWIGVHAIFGAFVAGAIIPHDSRLAREMSRRLEDLVAVVLLPAYFAFTGMRTEIGLVSGGAQWCWVLAIVGVATLGKFGGTAVAARVTGIDWRNASALGVLMNTRGLMELVVLNLGLDMRVISPTLFAMLVLMALVTTVATTPVLALLRVDEQGEITGA